MDENLSDWIYALKTSFTVLAFIVTLFFICSYFLAQLLGLVLFYFTPEGSLFSLRPIDPPYLIIVLLLLPIVIPVSGNYGALFLVIWGIFCLCLVSAFMTRENFLKSLKGLLKKPLSSFLRNNILSMPLITSTLFVTSAFLILLQESAGLPSGPGPSFPNPYEDLLWLSVAPVTEELGFRIIPLGLFLAIYITRSANTASLKFKIKLFFLSFLHPDKAKETLGVRSIDDLGLLRGISPPEWFIVAATAFLFGYAHLYFGNGVWDIGKIAPTAIVGFTFALSYLYYGIQAPILLHWFFNFYWQSFNLASGTYPMLSSLYETMEILTFIVGVIGMGLLLMIALFQITKGKDVPLNEGKSF